nr:hypothetical protein [Neobacillus sp. Marseille-Q6967]
MFTLIKIVSVIIVSLIIYSIINFCLTTEKKYKFDFFCLLFIKILILLSSLNYYFSPSLEHFAIVWFSFLPLLTNILLFKSSRIALKSYLLPSIGRVSIFIVLVISNIVIGLINPIEFNNETYKALYTTFIGALSTVLALLVSGTIVLQQLFGESSSNSISLFPKKRFSMIISVLLLAIFFDGLGVLLIGNTSNVYFSLLIYFNFISLLFITFFVIDLLDLVNPKAMLEKLHDMYKKNPKKSSTIINSIEEITRKAIDKGDFETISMVLSILNDLIEDGTIYKDELIVIDPTDKLRKINNSLKRISVSLVSSNLDEFIVAQSNITKVSTFDLFNIIIENTCNGASASVVVEVYDSMKQSVIAAINSNKEYLIKDIIIYIENQLQDNLNTYAIFFDELTTTIVEKNHDISIQYIKKMLNENKEIFKYHFIAEYHYESMIKTLDLYKSRMGKPQQY